MKKNTLYILAAAALVGFYFWNKSKKAKTTAAATATPTGTIEFKTIEATEELPVIIPTKLPFTMTDAQVGPGQQISPTPASVLDPAQLTKFNYLVKGSLNGVC